MKDNKTWTLEKLLKARAHVSLSYGDFLIPVAEVITTEELQDIVEENTRDVDIEFEVEDLIYEFLTNDIRIKVYE